MMHMAPMAVRPEAARVKVPGKIHAELLEHIVRRLGGDAGGWVAAVGTPGGDRPANPVGLGYVHVGQQAAVGMAEKTNESSTK